tara:strand:+ start:979 stop:1275 length:297 start_codon:yes stop_codon:yes gene_type:complete
MNPTLEETIERFEHPDETRRLVLRKEDGYLLTLSERKRGHGVPEGAPYFEPIYTLRMYMRFGGYGGVPEKWDASIDVQDGTLEEVYDFLHENPSRLGG